MKTRVDETAERAALESLAAGEPRRALAVLMDAYGAGVFRFCRAMLGDDAAAEDAMQTVFMDAHQSLGRFGERSSLLTWLLGIARHRCLDVLKSRQRWWRRFTSSATALERPDPGPLAEEKLVERVRASFLLACLDELPPEARMAVVLRCQEGLSYEDMGRMTRERPGTLQARVTRALPVLRACVKGKESSVDSPA